MKSPKVDLVPGVPSARVDAPAPAAPSLAVLTRPSTDEEEEVEVHSADVTRNAYREPASDAPRLRASEHRPVRTPGGPRLFVHESALSAADNAAVTDEDINSSQTQIVPRRTERTVAIGVVNGRPAFYSFTKGVRVLVPTAIVAHLERCGII